MFNDRLLYIGFFLLSCLATALVLCTIYYESLKKIFKETIVLFFYFVGGGIILAAITYFLTV